MCKNFKHKSWNKLIFHYLQRSFHYLKEKVSHHISPRDFYKIVFKEIEVIQIIAILNQLRGIYMG